MRQALGHDAETQIIGFIFIGTPTATPTERMRPTFEQVVSEWTGPAA